MRHWDATDKAVLGKRLREAAIHGIAIIAAGALVRLIGLRTWPSLLTFMVPYALWWMFLWVALHLWQRRKAQPSEADTEREGKA
jgi:hypothetical protein